MITYTCPHCGEPCGTMAHRGMVMPPYEALLADATRLPATDRLRLIDAIWDTLPDDALPPLSDEWTDEIRRRSAAYDAGAAVMVPWEQVKADALRRAGGAGSDATR